MIVAIFNKATVDAYGLSALHKTLEDLIEPYRLLSINSFVVDEEGNFPCSFALKNDVAVDRALSNVAQNFNETLTNPEVQTSIVTDAASHPSFAEVPQQYRPDRVLDVRLK